MKGFKILPLLLLIAGLYSPLKAQTIAIFDTIYATIENQPWVGTMFIPSEGNGIGVLVVHGDGVLRPTNRPWCDSLAGNGYTVFTIEYPIGGFPLPARAVKLAIEFLRKNAQSFGITTGQIAGLGFSYGSATFGQTIIWDNDDSYFQTDSLVDDHLNAVALFYGGYTFGDFSNDTLRQKGLCINHVANITTPVLLLHGTGDTHVDYHESVTFKDSLTFYGKESQLILFNGLEHGFDLNWPAANEFTTAGLQAKDSVLSFFRNNMITDVKQDKDNDLSRDFHLQQNYPNPFNPSTIIKYSVPQLSQVQIKVFDVLGNEIETLVSEEKPAGSYEVEFDALTLTSGIYFDQLIAVDPSAGSGKAFVETKKMVLLR